MRLSKSTPLIGYLSGLAGVAVVTVAIHLFLVGHIAVANISILYLIAVLATAAAFGSGPAILTSIAAFITVNWLYIEPIGAFNFGTPAQQFCALPVPRNRNRDGKAGGGAAKSRPAGHRYPRGRLAIG